MLLFDSSRAGNDVKNWKRGRTVVLMVQGGGDRQSYCTVAKDVSASCHPNNQQTAFWELITAASELEETLQWWGIREPVQ